MKRFIIAFLMVLIIPVISFAWTDTGGSTVAATGGEGWEMKDIQNDVHDIPHSAWSVYNISSGPYHTQNWIWNGNDWFKLEASPSNYDGQSTSSITIGSRSFLYGYNGSTWDRLRSNNNKMLVVETTTGSTISRVYEVREATSAIRGGVLDQVLRLIESTGTTRGGILDELLRVIQATTTMRGGILDEIYRIDESSSYIRGGHIDNVYESTSHINGGNLDSIYEGTMTARGGKLDELLRILESSGFLKGGNLDYVFESTSHVNGGILDELLRVIESSSYLKGGNIDQILRIIESTSYVKGGYLDYITSISGITQSTSCVRGGVLDEILRIIESTGYFKGGKIDEIYRLLEGTVTIRGGKIDEVLVVDSCSVRNFPSDFPDSTAQSSLGNIDTNTGNIYSELNSTPSVSDIRYTNKISTGTSGKLLISGAITIPNSIDGYSFYSVGGDTEINANWKAGTLYCIDGISIAPTKLSIPVASPTLNCVLNYGTTLYYDLNCINP